MLNIRPEVPADKSVIARVIDRAFTGHPHSSGTEAAIVRNLRAAGALSLSLVAEIHGQVQGYIAASLVDIAGRPTNWHGLGPVAIDPTAQGVGLGSKLITECLAQLRSLGSGGCFVLGDPAYYGRFGFQPDSRFTYQGPPPEYFMVLPFDTLTQQGEVTYHAAFTCEA